MSERWSLMPRWLRRSGTGETCAGPDEVLLERFVANRDEAAFTALLTRYGPLVLGTCQRVLRHQQDAEDAYQATFLVLARKADSIGKRQSVGSWLYGVAYRVALQVRRGASRWRKEAQPLPDVPGPEAKPDESGQDLRPLLDEELGRLPTKFRDAVVLCYLEGKSTEEAATALGCPRGTVLSRLARARERLRGRLVRRGITLSLGALTAFLSGLAAGAALPANLTSSIWQTVQSPVRKRGAEASRAETLADAFESARRVVRVKLGGALVLTMGLLGGAIGLFLLSRGQRTGPADPLPDRERLQGTWEVIAVWNFGQPLPAEQLPNVPPLIIAGDRLRFGELDATLQLHPERTPKEMDLVWPDGQVMEGIYRWDGDELTTRHGRPGVPRPTTFADAPGDPTLRIVFRKK
jgi:RNA polymerase sigma factor (sigma-70 family)